MFKQYNSLIYIYTHYTYWYTMDKINQGSASDVLCICIICPMNMHEMSYAYAKEFAYLLHLPIDKYSCCHKPFNQWQHSFLLKAVLPLAERLMTPTQFFSKTRLILPGYFQAIVTISYDITLISMGIISTVRQLNQCPGCDKYYRIQFDIFTITLIGNITHQPWNNIPETIQKLYLSFL